MKSSRKWTERICHFAKQQYLHKILTIYLKDFFGCYRKIKGCILFPQIIGFIYLGMQIYLSNFYNSCPLKYLVKRLQSQVWWPALRLSLWCEFLRAGVSWSKYAINDKEHIKNATWWNLIMCKFKDREEDI